MNSKSLDELLTTLEVQLKAFAMCEIGSDWRLHVDPFESVICHFVVRGHGYFEFGSRRIPIAEGTIIIVPPGTEKSVSGPEPVRHEVSAVDSCDSYRDGLLLFRARSAEPSLVLGCATIAATCGGGVGLFEGLTEPCLAAVGGDGLFAAGFRALQQELTDPKIGAMIVAECLMKQTVVFLLREQLQGEDNMTLLDHLGDPRIVRAVAAITRSPGEQHTIESLAALAGMSRSSFMVHFVREYHTSPGEFLKAARMRAAARMLVRSEVPIKCLAPAVGYASRSQFSHAFKQSFGTDPSAYRAANRTSPGTSPPQPQGEPNCFDQRSSAKSGDDLVEVVGTGCETFVSI